VVLLVTAVDLVAQTMIGFMIDRTSGHFWGCTLMSAFFLVGLGCTLVV
jgi:hypothetical protein